MSSAGSTGDETPDSDDVSLNDLSANHNNELFAGTVATACVDSLANVDFLPPDELETEQINNTSTSRTKKKLQDEDKQYLLADNSEYAPVVGDESANLWNKAMTTLAKGKCSKEDEQQQGTAKYSNSSSVVDGEDARLPKKAAKPAFDMAPILMDESIDGGRAPSIDPNAKRPSGRVVPSSDYSIDGESAMVWGDDPEKAYFSYMLEQEAEQRAMEGKDQDDSLVGESVRQELLNNNNRNEDDANTFDEDSTTLGHGSKAMGWDRSTVVGTSAMGGVSTLTPSHLASSQERDKNGRKIIPNVIYVQDGTNPKPEATFVKSKQKPREQARASGNNRRSNSAKNKTVPKQVDGGYEDPNNDDASRREPKPGWYTNRILIGFALFFLILTTGLVAALIVYRNHYADETTTTTGSSNLDENGNPIVPPTQAPIISNSRTFTPTISLGKKDDSDNEAEDDEEENEDETKLPTAEPTWLPTGAPTWIPTKIPTFVPTAVPSFKPTRAPTSAPSVAPTRDPSIRPTETASGAPTQVPSVAPSKTPTTKKPTAEPTRISLTPPALNTSAPEVDFTTPPTESGNYTTIVVVPTIDDDAVEDEVDPIFNSTNAISDTGASESDWVPTSKPTKMPSTKMPSSKMPSSKMPSSKMPSTKSPSPSRTPTTTITPSSIAPVAGTPPPYATVVTLSPTRPPSRQPTTAPTRPTPVPSSVPETSTPTSPAPVPSYVALERVRAFLLEYSPTSTPELFDQESTQFAALQWLAQWMASIPAQQLGRITKKRLVQRWVLAVLYLSMNGPNWLNGADDWMGDDDACDWISDNSQGSCDGNDLVNSLDLSNNNLRGSLPKELSLLRSMSA